MIELTEHDQALLGGQRGDAAALAMRVLVRSAALMGAERLLDITSAHIDGCLYHGQASLDFVERMVAGGGKVVVPTTLNVGSLDLIHPELFRGDAVLRSQAQRLMQAHLELGCESTFTCAPYQSRDRPRLGQQIAWAESNAIVFANSVLGARTNRYGDFMDLCAALTGRAPSCGLHLTENRLGQVLFELQDFPAGRAGRDIWFAALGLFVGKQVGARIPVFAGLPPDTSEDELKALGAACAATGAVGLFHAVGITPEAPTLAEAFGGRPVPQTLAVSRAQLQRTRAALSAARPGDRLAAVSVGTPHFSLAEFEQLLSLLAEEEAWPRVDFYVNTSRFILSRQSRNQTGNTIAIELTARGTTMAATALIERCAPNLHGVLSCYDRLIVTGTLPGACYAGGMTSFLYSRGIRTFDYPKFAEPLRECIRERAQEVCAASAVSIEYVNKSHIRKEDLVARVLAKRGNAPGLVHVISAMESCPSYKPWLDKSNGHIFLRGDTGKCLHYYFYFIDEEFGLCYLRVPTWAPFGLQFYCNGHSALACSLKREGIEFVQEDNAFLRVADLARAQALADAFNPEQLHRRLTRDAHWLCPVADVFAQDDWHWSIRQAEYSTDLMFRSEQILVPLYDAISRQAVLAADAPRVAGFLGKKITPALAQEIGSRLSTRIEGRCIKHCMGAAGVKVYDKFSRVLRIETTVNEVSFFKHHRKVEHKGAPATRELAPLKKSIYSLIDLREILLGCNQRYLAFLSSLDDPSAGERDLQRLSQPRVGTEPSIKGLNFFNATDHQLLCTLQRGEFNIHGWRRADLVARLKATPSAMTRQLRRLRALGLIKKVTHTYRYYLTRLSRAAIAAACSLTRFNIVPAMAAAH